MGLEVCSTTIHEAAGGGSAFPEEIRDLLCKAVAEIKCEELPELLDRHESDPKNFDGRIEQNIRTLRPDLTVHANHRISESTKFNIDLVLEANGALVCVEIEKGSMSRFEFDVLKMQAFASQRLAKRPDAKVYGGFIVPKDNVVARHISGNARESSYRYLGRLGRLVAQIESHLMDDILIVGYSPEMPERKPMKRTPGGTGGKSGNVIKSDKGLLPDELVWDVFRGYPKGLVQELRERLAAEFPGLREKANRSSKYLGYSNRHGDRVYTYVRKRHLLLDMRLAADMADDLKPQGFQVKPRDNYQAKVGWLTGVIVPHDTDKFEIIIELAIQALSEE